MLILGVKNFPSKTYIHASNFDRKSSPDLFFVSPTLPNFPQISPNQKNDLPTKKSPEKILARNPWQNADERKRISMHALP